jgi:hypothetical protein
MDSRVSARFFRVSDKPKEAPDFPDLLLAEAAKDRVDREVDLGGKTVLRVEECTTNGEFVVGDLCRKQVANLPPEVGPEGLAPTILADGRGLGHLAAFVYHRPTRVILLQNNPQCASPNRISNYLATLNAAALYTFDPVPRDDALDRFKARKPRSFQLRIASPENLESLDDTALPSVRGAKMLADAFHGLYVTVTIDVGRSQKKVLDAEAVQTEVSGLLASGVDIRDLKVGTQDQGDDEPPSIDFLSEHLKCSEVIDLPEQDVVNHYAKRKAYLEVQFGRRLQQLTAQYVKAK